MRPDTGRAVVAPAVSDRGSIKGVNASPVGRGKGDVDAGSALAAWASLAHVVRQPEEGFSLHSVADTMIADALLGLHFHYLDDAERCQRRIIELARSLEISCTDAHAVDHRVIPSAAISNVSSSPVEQV